MTYLVAGATGSVGRHVVAELVRRGQAVRALTRDAGRAVFGDGDGDGVDVVQGDLSRPETVAPHLEGVTGLHMVTFAGDDYAPLETGEELLALARAAGVRRVTLLLGTQGDAVERAVRASGLAWTFVKPVEFMSNALEWADQIKAGDAVREPFVDRLSAMVHEADIGAVAATALVEEGHAGQTYLVTGPEAITVRDKVAAIAAAREKPIELIELSEAEARANWRAQGMSDALVEFFVEIYGNTPAIGRSVQPTVEQVTGRPARSFAQWAREHAAQFV